MPRQTDPTHERDETSRPPSDSRGPLAGLTVLELAGLGPVPFTGMMLADLGATVVQVRRPADKQARGLDDIETLADSADVVQRGRSTVEVDLKSDEGRELLLRLSDTADVFIEGFRPGVVERMGIGPEQLCARNPRLIYARLSGYGQSGPLSDTAGHDINYVAMSGLLHAVSRPGVTPFPPLNLLADYAGGAMLAAFGVMAAAFETQLSGKGQVVDVSMLDGVGLLGARLRGLRTMSTWSEPPGTNFIDGAAPYYNVYETSDGQHVAVGALEARFYAAMLDGFDCDTSEWPDRRDRQQWPRLHELMADVFRQRSRDEWARQFADTDACVSPVLTMDEAIEHRQSQSRGSYVPVEGGPQPAPAPRFSRTPSPPVTTPRCVSSAEVIAVWEAAHNPTSRN